MRLVTLIVVFVTCSSTAFAQSMGTSFADLEREVKKGTVVFVEDERGERVKGTITDLSPTSIQLMTPGVSGREMTFGADRVTRVGKVDSRLNGFLIGAVAGMVPGIYLAYLVDTYCENEATDCPMAYPLFGGVAGLAGGGIGYAIDAAIDGQKVVFARRSGTAGAGVRMGPIVGSGRTGARLSIRF